MTDANIVEFAKWVIREGAFAGVDLDCCYIMEKAEKLGLVEKTKYDPAIHGPSEFDCPPGEDWYVFAPMLAKAPKSITEQT